jgi:hypothetical protein
MRKYVIAAVGAVMVFSMAAFAASMNVDGGFLQAGADSGLTCTDDAEVSYETSNDTTGHWIDAVELQFDAACEGGYAIVNGFGPANNNQILSLISTPIDNTGKVVIDIFDGPTRVKDLVNVQVLVKDRLAGNECAGMEYSGNPIAPRVTCP